MNRQILLPSLVVITLGATFPGHAQPPQQPAAINQPVRDSTSRSVFNGHLSGHKIVDVPAPATTVLFYDGTPGALNYRYDDKAAVGFADGHCALVTPDEAKNLIWDPFAVKAP